MLDLRLPGPREIARRLLGFQQPLKDVESAIRLVVESGRRWEADLLYEAGIQSWVASDTQPAVAGQNGHLAFNANTVDPNVLVIVERVELYTNTVLRWRAFLEQSDSGVGGTGVVALPRDTRWAGQSRIEAVRANVAVVRGTSAVVPPAGAAPIGLSHEAADAGANTTVFGDATRMGVGDSTIGMIGVGPIVLRGLDQLVFQAQTLNVTFAFNATGYVLRVRSDR